MQRPCHWAPSHRCGCSSEPPPKQPLAPPLAIQVQQQGRAAERLAEEQCRAELARNNMGNIDEIVFGRDMDGL